MLISNANLSPLVTHQGQIVEVVATGGDTDVVVLRIRAKLRLRDALPDQEIANAPPAPEFETPVVVDPYRRRLWN